MVTIPALVVAAGEGAVGVVHVGAGLGEHVVFAEDMGGSEAVGARLRIHKSSRDDDVIKHLP